MTPSVRELQSRLKDCRTRDQRKFKRRLEKISRQDAAADALQKLAQQVEVSVSWVRQRDNYKAPLHFPDLPIAERREEISKALAQHQVVVIAGETGSGKTTQLPKICWELGRGRFGQIGHTQPRRLAARAVANRIAEEMQVPLGELVGFQVRFGDQTSDETRIKLMTDGILLAEIQQDPFLNRYDTLIIDEAHERSLNIDFLLGYLKRILPKRPDLKLIITSATIDLERFSQHFDNAPIIEVSGRTYPVELHYRPLLAEGEGEQDLSLQQAVIRTLEEIESLERQQGLSARGDVLVFLSGEREIRETADKLRRHQFRDTDVLPLYARLSAAEQNRIFNPSGLGRRVVLATNVAETSLTVPGIRYVIDPGMARISRYSYRSKVQRLPIEPISQASANQRKGRCGRIAEGVCFRLYDEDDFNNRSEFTDAEILRTNLAAVILQMAGLKLGKVEDFPFIDPPDSRFVRDGVRLLQELKALDQQGDLTPLGRQLSKLPVDPKLGRMLIEAAKTQCLTELLVITSALSIQDPRERPLDKQQKADEAHRQYQDKESDFISLLNLWNLYEEQRQELSNSQLRSFCQKNFLAFMRMREWRDLHRQLHLACKELKLGENKTPAGYAVIHQALLAGLLGNIGLRQEEGDYLGARNRKFRIFPGSGLAKARPKWVVAAELVETSQLFARVVAKIEPEWIEPLAQHLVKHSYVEPHWERKPAEVIAFEQQTLYGLPIVNRRRIHYGKIDPALSQELFIRSALVEGDFRTEGDFFTHNQQMLKDVEALEEKSRRRDILVDEEQLFDFYQQCLADNNGAAVVNGASFERWRKLQESSNPDLLKVTQAFLMQHDAAAITEQRFPEYYVWKGMRFPLSYQFSPGAENDGVTLSVPVGALNQLPVQRLEWLVPGMLREKCIALLKALPKQVRKNFVPIPDYVDAFIEGHQAEEQPLCEVLSSFLRRTTGHRIEPELWNAIALDPHHLFNIRVLDTDGKRLAQGRDWPALVQQFADLQAAAPVQHKKPTEDIGKDWPAEDLPRQIEIRQAGMVIQAYRALSFEGGRLCVQVHDSEALAHQAQIEATVELLRRNLERELKVLQKQLPAWKSVALKLSTIGRDQELWQDFVYALLKAQLMENNTEIKNSAGFAALLSQVKSQLHDDAIELSRTLNAIASLYIELRKTISGAMQLQWVTVLTDMRSQLERLMSKGFIRFTPVQWLQRYPVYLMALKERNQRFQQDLNKQRYQSEVLAELYQRFDQAAKKATVDTEHCQHLQTYRWMLEEYRISLFAQHLKTLMPVSEKRLEKYWREHCV